MLNELVALFFAVALLFYCLFAGADFGGGILEAFLGPKHREAQRELITHAISPVWEANHVWLILAVVILFVGYPAVYAKVSVLYHIPLTLMLLGIVLRGCTFTFRHYDAVKGRSQRYYSACFVVASFVTPFMLGTIAGAAFLGRHPARTVSFAEAYVYPWANVFSFSVGAFACVLFAFLAAVYLIGETNDHELRELFRARARAVNLAAVISGTFVLIAAEADDLPLVALLAKDRLSLACLTLATGLLLPLWHYVNKGAVQRARFFVAAQIGFILLGWFRLQFPALLTMRGEGGTALTIYNSAAPEATQRYLLGALIVGSGLIFPSLGYLLATFKRAEPGGT